MIGEYLPYARFVVPWALGLICVPVSLAEIVDDFSEGGWHAGNPKAPARVEASKGRLVITDLPGGEVTWGTCAAKRYDKVSIEATPFLVIDVAGVSGGFGAKLSGGKPWPKRTVCSVDNPGLFVIDIANATGWEAKEGRLLVMLYAHGDGSQVEIRSLRITGELNDKEKTALQNTSVTPPRPKTVPHAGLIRQAARQGDKPSCADPEAGERTVYTDPVTGREVWRMTDHPAVERHVYYDILAWNANGSTIMWTSRRPGGRYLLMDADGTHIRPLPPPADRGSCRGPHWSPNQPHIMYFARSDAERTTVMTLDVRDGKVAEIASVPFPMTIESRRFSELTPPHPDERHFLLRWGGQDRHATMLVVVDSETGKHWKLEPGIPTHRVRFTKKNDQSVFINSNTDPDKPGERARTEWIVTLDGHVRRLPPGGGHPDWTPDGSWLGVFRDAGNWFMSHDGQTRKELVNTMAGGHGGFSITTGKYHVADAPARGPYGNLVYVTELATGKVTPIAYHGSSYSGWSSDVPDPEATHPAPICSPDETKIIYDSDVIGQPDVWVAVWKRPAISKNVRFEAGTLAWLPPELHREIAGYNIYRKEDGQWFVVKSLVADTQLAGLAEAQYAVAAQEWSGLESKYVVANTGEVTGDTFPPSAPTQPRVLETASTHIVIEWEAPPDEDHDHYSVYASPEPNVQPCRADLVGSPKIARFVDWGIEGGTTLYYRVTAVDRQGNESKPSAAVKAVTGRVPE